uniref:Remorin C-terminal domain-containing protein n=1 Tax=Rhizophora mucronata TaxID=61149 RepID=A0A2P2QYI3_RHIMU
MDDINQIAVEAKAKVAERRRKKEFKAKEKANIIRETGKIPKTCFCFYIY